MPEMAENVALELLTRDGIEVIWHLHLAAAAAHRLGHRAGTETLLKIAEAAEAIWSHDDHIASKIRPPLGLLRAARKRRRPTGLAHLHAAAPRNTRRI